MAIISKDIDREFSLAKRGDSSPQMVEASRPRLAKLGVEAGVKAGAMSYGQALLAKIDGFRKSGSSMGASSGGADVLYSSPEIRNPLLNLINFYLPYDRKTLNQWIRYYDRFQPYIGNCYLETTKVLRCDGSLTDIINIGMGDKVISHKGVPQEVVSKFRTPLVNAQCIRITSSGNELPLEVTADHIVYVVSCKCKHGEEKLSSKTKLGRQTDQCLYGKGRFCKLKSCISNDFVLDGKRACEVKPGDYVYTPSLSLVIDSGITKQQARILGWYAAEGYIVDSRDSEWIEGNKVCQRQVWLKWGLHEKDSYGRASFDILKSEQYAPFSHENNGCWCVGVTSNVLADFCEYHVGRGSHDKKLSIELMQSPVDVQLEFLAGYLQGDGSRVQGKAYDKRNFLSWGSASSDLTQQLRSLMERCGMSPSTYGVTQKGKGKWPSGALRKDYRRYDGHVSKSESNALLPLMGEEVFKVFRIRRGDHFNCGHSCLSLVIKVEEFNYSGYVYDLGVDEDHTLVANGVASHNCIDIHGEFPISDFHFTGITDDKVLDIFEEQKDRADILQYCYEASREYELIGEVYAFWSWDEDANFFDDYVIINPDLLDVKTVSWGQGKRTLYKYEPPQELKDLVHDKDERMQEVLEELDEVVKESLESGQPILLNDFNVMQMKRLASPYDSRGTSIILRVIKELMYEDKLREAQYAIADQQITPVQIWKLGDPASGYMPNDDDLREFRQLLLAGRHDPLFTIVSHGAIELDLVGYTGHLLPVIPEFEWVAKRVLVGLYTNEAMVTGQGPTYSNAIISMKVLQGRYQTKRDKIRKNLQKKIFEKVALAHKIFERTPAELDHRIRTSNRPAVPDIEWNFKLELTDESQRLQYLMTLRDKTDIPMKVLCEVLNLDYDSCKKSLQDEMGSVFDPSYKAAREAKAKEMGTAGPEGGMMGGGAMGGSPEVGGEVGAEASAEAPAEAPAGE